MVYTSDRHPEWLADVGGSGNLGRTPKVPILFRQPTDEQDDAVSGPRWRRDNQVSGSDAQSRTLRVAFPSGMGETTVSLTRSRSKNFTGRDPRPVLESDEIDPNHHLWRNGRLWWVAFTVHLPNWQKERIRTSLGTDDIDEARSRRDDLLSRYPEYRGCELSLRLQTRGDRPSRPRSRRENEMSRTEAA